ncbi:gamma-glutamylcyclotransferase [Patescibacteria group bacterium]|nr:gamma-glutamylcyclotransferase [Patescibacteria group bacterium]MBU1938836.1 gamma-glutamylcyclotransferase [Patescibacteria group bacterium]
MTNHYIFSYGSLAHKEVAGISGRTLDFLPAVLKGFKRNFRVLAKSSGFAAAGIEEDRESEILGMMVQVPESELPKFDERESLYDRIEIRKQQLNLLSGEPVPEGHYYLYVPKNPQPPTEQIPLAQSYIDVMLAPFIILNPNWAITLVKTMGDLDKPWVNDRKMPMYSRYPVGIDGDAVDRLLMQTVPDKFAERRDAEDLRVKPELVRSILSTIRFFDIFDYPLTAEEVINYLYKYKKPLHIKELKATLDHLVDSGELVEIKGYFVLSGRESTVETRKTRKFIAEKFWNRAKLYGQYMRSVPFTKMIAVCNNLAYNNPSEQSDIDLFIVVKPGRMWLARFLITLILHFYGVRRYGNKVAGRFCLSFFVTSDKTDMREFELPGEDPYLAYWAKNLRPIFGEKDYLKFREQNKEWLAQYGLSFDDSYKKHMYHYEEGPLKKFSEWLLGGFLGDQFEKLLKATLKKKTLRSMNNLGVNANVIVTDEILKFHNYDRRQEYLERWRKNV